MKKYCLSLLAFCLTFTGCTPKTVISRTYDFNQMKRIGIMSFESSWSSLQGVENLFAKYLISAGFKVVERAQLESVLQEHNISVSGYLSPQTTRQIGKILGVDVLLVGEVTAYTPTRTELTMVATRRTESRPVYTQEVMQLPDEYSHSSEVTPQEYTINAQVGVIAKLVDVETGEVIWIGSDDAEGSSALSAADYLARVLVKSFTKELANLQKE